MPLSPSIYPVFAVALCSTINAHPIMEQYQLKHRVKPSLTLAIEHEDGVLYQNYFASEKYDGIRAFWDGEQLMTRSGRVLNPPIWFIAALPTFAVEGELWVGYGRFSELQSIVLSDSDTTNRWSKVQFILFDMPEHKQDFISRYQALMRWCEDHGNDQIVCTIQTRVTDKQQVFKLLEEITQRGGEGVMLRHANMRYISGRNSSLIKLKAKQDGEARVVGYRQGAGKYQNMVGSLQVEIEGGKRFYLGSGLTEHDRQYPPKLGDIVTYEYSGYTSTGLPRFARFKRVRVFE